MTNKEIAFALRQIATLLENNDLPRMSPYRVDFWPETVAEGERARAAIGGDLVEWRIVEYPGVHSTVYRTHLFGIDVDVNDPREDPVPPKDLVWYPEETYDGFQDDNPPPECPACGGDGGLLGELGRFVWFRCIQCGIDFLQPVREITDTSQEKP